MSVQDYINEQRGKFFARKEVLTNPVYNEEKKMLLLKEEMKEEQENDMTLTTDTTPIVIQQIHTSPSPSVPPSNLEMMRVRIGQGVKNHFREAKSSGHIFSPNPKKKLLNPLFHGKKGMSVISIIFFTLVFIIFWVLAFAEQLAYWGHQTVVNNGLTGVEALFYNNINFVVLFVLMIFILGFAYFGLSGD